MIYFRLISILCLFSPSLFGISNELINSSCGEFQDSAVGGTESLIDILSISLRGYFSGGSLLIAGLLALLAGFLTALTPCVYPLIPITLGIMGARNYESRLHGFTVALSYVMGMVILYSTLGISFAFFGILAGSTLQSPIVTGTIGIFYIFLALVMVGAFKVVLPQSLLQRVVNIGGAGHRGAFMMGLVAGIIAAPCTGPVLAFILTLVAIDREIVKGAYLTFFYAFGIGVPFLILGTFSSAISRLPKGGKLSSVVKYVLAAAICGAGIYYLNMAFPAFENKAQSSLNWVIVGKHDSREKLEGALAAAREQCKPVVMDFYADWCVACRELEADTFSDARVAQALEEFVLIKIDATLNSPVIEAIQRDYGIVGLPTMLFFQPNGTLIKNLRITEYVPADAFRKFLKKIK